MTKQEYERMIQLADQKGYRIDQRDGSIDSNDGSKVVTYIAHKGEKIRVQIGDNQMSFEIIKKNIEKLP